MKYGFNMYHQTPEEPAVMRIILIWNILQTKYVKQKQAALHQAEVRGPRGLHGITSNFIF